MGVRFGKISTPISDHISAFENLIQQELEFVFTVPRHLFFTNPTHMHLCFALSLTYIFFSHLFSALITTFNNTLGVNTLSYNINLQKVFSN